MIWPIRVGHPWMTFFEDKGDHSITVTIHPKQKKKQIVLRCWWAIWVWQAFFVWVVYPSLSWSRERWLWYCHRHELLALRCLQGGLILWVTQKWTSREALVALKELCAPSNIEHLEWASVQASLATFYMHGFRLSARNWAYGFRFHKWGGGGTLWTKHFFHLL